jgi:hypothetical protein
MSDEQNRKGQDVGNAPAPSGSSIVRLNTRARGVDDAPKDASMPLSHDEPAPVNIPMPMFGGEKPLGFDSGDEIEPAFNMRDWIRDAVQAKGAKMIGGGIGFGQADIDIELEGHVYNISIRARKRGG